MFYGISRMCLFLFHVQIVVYCILHIIDYLEHNQVWHMKHYDLLLLTLENDRNINYLLHLNNFVGVNISKILMYLVICQLPNLAFIPFCVILPSHDAPYGHLTHFQVLHFIYYLHHHHQRQMHQYINNNM